MSKTGKHGHAKCHFTGIDIFTKKKVEGLESSTHGILMPVVSKAEYTLVGMTDEGYLTLMDDNGETREDLMLPTGDEHKDLVEEIMKAYEDEKDLTLSVTKAMGTEMVLDYKEDL